MTPSEFKSFVKSALRKAAMKWPPINNVRKNARVERGRYLCNMCKQVVPASKVVIKNGVRKRTYNIVVDHIVPVVPTSGFDSWDGVIHRLFCDEDNLQLLCRECHDKKCLAETQERKSNN